MPFPNAIRFYNKKITNRVLIKLAGKPHSPFSILYHTGRKSGNVYAIPIIVTNTTGGFLFALTYGSQVEWVKNIWKAHSAELLWHGVAYTLSSPNYVEPHYARLNFPLPLQWILALLKIDQFLEMKASLIP